MSWFVWIFGFAVVLGASQLARFKGYDDTKVSAILLAGLIGAVGYSFIGRAELADQPYADRTAELAARDPLTLSAGERLALLESLTKSQPDAPQPHFFIGDMMRDQGRDSDAIRAYQSALRRDDRFVPAILGMGDALTRLSGGKISDDAKRMYARAVAIDPAQVRAGFLTGLADWQSGDKQSARARWKTVRDGLSSEDPRLEMLDALIQQAEAGALQ